MIKTRNLKNLFFTGYIGKNNFTPGKMLNFIFFLFPARWYYYFFDFELERAGELEIFILLCARGARNNFLEQNSCNINNSK
jgi:hypothetical protein